MAAIVSPTRAFLRSSAAPGGGHYLRSDVADDLVEGEADFSVGWSVYHGGARDVSIGWSMGVRRLAIRLAGRNGVPLASAESIAASVWPAPAAGQPVTGSPLLALTGVDLDAEGWLQIDSEQLPVPGESVLLVLDALDESGGTPVRRLGAYVLPIIIGG